MKFIYVVVFVFILVFDVHSSNGSEALADRINSVLSKVDKVKIEKLRGGVSKYLRTIRYEELSRFITALNAVSKVVKKHPVDIILMTYNKPNVLKSFIGGLYNPDPRVRITCSLILQDIVELFSNVRISNAKSSLTAEFISKRHRYVYLRMLLSVHSMVRQVWYMETVNNRLYGTVAIDGKKVSKNPYKEIDALDLLIINKIALHKVETGEIAVKDFGTNNVDKRIFIALAEGGAISSIDNSGYILINSLRYKDKAVQQKASDLLLVMYYNPSTNNQMKNKIKEARREYKVLEDTFQNYINKRASSTTSAKS